MLAFDRGQRVFRGTKYILLLVWWHEKKLFYSLKTLCVVLNSLTSCCGDITLHYTLPGGRENNGSLPCGSVYFVRALCSTTLPQHAEIHQPSPSNGDHWREDNNIPLRNKPSRAVARHSTPNRTVTITQHIHPTRPAFSARHFERIRTTTIIHTGNLFRRKLFWTIFRLQKSTGSNKC